MTRRLLLLLVCSFGAMASFYLLLSVVPLYAASGGASGFGSGLVTGALMLATVAGELLVPRLLARLGYRAMFALGLLLLGAPAFLLVASSALPLLLAVSLVRGAGLAIAVVVGAALVAELVPRERRGEGMGLYGIAVGVPSIVAMPLGVWLAGEVGFPAVFVASGVAGLLGLVTVPGLPGRARGAEPSMGILGGLRLPGVVRLCVVFGAITMATGVIVTFVPLAVDSAALASAALFAQAAAMTLVRWWSGRFGDRHGAGRLLLPAVLAAGAGIAGLVLIDSPVAVLAGMVVFGAGFGVAQNATLVLMFERVDPTGYGVVSALWNLAYDAGLGIGAVGFGAVLGLTGYPVGFAITAGLVLLALVPAAGQRQERTAPHLTVSH